MHVQFMKQACELASKYRGLTGPNPCVAALIVKGSMVVGSGCHVKAGSDHAEVLAIQEVMSKSGIQTVDIDPSLFKNATLYVTLEPCVHVGKTPACVDSVIKAGFSKVVIGMKDPFSLVNGKGIKMLKKAGIAVDLVKEDSSLGKMVRSLNQPFIKWARTGFPYLTLKSGMSLDGKIATSGGESQWITSEVSRKDARMERSLHDCVVVGSGTVLSDDPELAPHGKFKKKNLLRVIIDRKLSLSFDHKVFRDENVFVVCTGLASERNRARYKKAGFRFRQFGKDVVNVKSLLKHLGSKNIQSVFVEGGSEVSGLFVDAASKDASLIDQVVYYYAPMLLGGRKATSVVAGEGVSSLKNAISFSESEFSVSGKDLKFSGKANLY
jgi:diaminohydroxyphosphoribosylaminopyrimidine deaminase / 5-amino-6-(5-phosphoribosylamino)uracil reductase